MPETDTPITRRAGTSGYQVTLRHGGIAMHGSGQACTAAAGPTPAAAGSVLTSLLCFHGRGCSQGCPAATTVPHLQLCGNGAAPAGAPWVQTLAVTEAAPTPIALDGRIVGCTFADADADCCLLTGILPADPHAPRAVQAESCLRQAARALAQAGMTFGHVARTWFFLADVLDWYDAFNRVRTAFFEEHGVFRGLLPASTGIGARNAAGAAVAAAVLALRPRHAGLRVTAVPSPLQGPAPNYRSSFSRAVEITAPGRRHLLISGTASIDTDGRSLHPGDVAPQIERTLDVLEALLRSRGMGWEDVTRAIAYACSAEDLPLFAAACRRRGLPPLPLLAAGDVAICRRELRFEIELDAARYGL
jgi:enamine deaminase RidA (YjgF/YER057c/UK114 family)